MYNHSTIIENKFFIKKILLCNLVHLGSHMHLVVMFFKLPLIWKSLILQSLIIWNLKRSSHIFSDFPHWGQAR